MAVVFKDDFAVLIEEVEIDHQIEPKETKKFFHCQPYFNIKMEHKMSVQNVSSQLPPSPSIIGKFVKDKLLPYLPECLFPNKIKQIWEDKYITPLDLKDDCIMTICAITALAVICVALPLLGKAFIVTGVIASATTLICGGTYVRHRSKMKLSHEALEQYINPIILGIYNSSSNNFQVRITQLTTPKYEHIKDKIDEIGKTLTKFQTNIGKPNANINELKATLIEKLEQLRLGIVPYEKRLTPEPKVP